MSQLYRPMGGHPPPPPPPPPPHPHGIMYNMPLPQHSHIPPSYGTLQPHNPYSGEPLAPLAPGQQPVAAEPQSISLEENGRRYELKVIQQPIRARMCGFGDKDRRPITPPPCIKLIITDIKTGKECDVNDIDHGMFVLSVDLWSPDGTRELNLVRSSQTIPSIGAAPPLSYAESTASQPAYSQPAPIFKMENQGHGQGQAYNPFPGQPQVNPYASPQPSYSNGPSQYQQQPGYPPNGAHYPPPNAYSQGPPTFYSGAGIHAMGASGPPQPIPSQIRQHPPEQVMQRAPVNGQAPQGMFTRNLIGSLAASAFRLTEPDNRIGIWFVLQDLSVRTEGNFRLRFSFVNVGVPGSSPQPSQPPHNVPSGTNLVALTQVNTHKAPVLAQVFSDSFTVYSAKRFPGVVESTALSKCFATQGIKIPIRKDGPGKNDKALDFDED